MAVIGQRLAMPEEGWTRFDNSDANIDFEGDTWSIGLHSSWYGGTKAHTGTSGALGHKIKFNFTGSKLRILVLGEDDGWARASKNVRVVVDGKDEGSCVTETSSDIFTMLGYELTNLSDKEHSVVIENMEDKRMTLDALDLGDGELLKPFKEVQNKYLFKDGEEIKKYGQSEWVKYTGNLEPDKSIPQWTKISSQVSGLVAEGALNINDSGSGYCVYSRNNIVNPDDVVKMKAMVKVLSSSSEFTLTNSPPLMLIRDGAKALIVGLFPTKIVEYQSKLSYDLDLSSYREIELIKNGATGWEIYVDGMKVLSGSSFEPTTTNDVAFSGASSNGEGDSYWKYVHYSANDVGNRSMGLISVGQLSITKELFDIHGMTDLSLINDEEIQQLNSDQVELLCWTDEVTPVRKVGITGLPRHALIAGSSDIQLEGAEKIVLAMSQASGALIRIAISSDDGATWEAKSSMTLSDLASVKANGFTPEELNALTKEQIAALFPNGTARFAFYLEQENDSDVVEIQSLSIGEKAYTISPTATDLSLIYEVLQEESPTLYASRDDGVSWKEVSQDEMATLSEQPEGNILRVKAVLSSGQEVYALSYAWV